MEEEKKTQSTARERVGAAYKGGFADRVPAYPIAGAFAGCLDGLPIEEYCTNPTKAVKAMLNYYERYQPDIMIAFNDLAKEAEAIGCRVKYSDYVVPSIDRHVLQDDKGKLASLEIPDPKRDGRLPAFLEQCSALSAAGIPSPLGSVNVGPWTIAMLMRNPEVRCGAASTRWARAPASCCPLRAVHLVRAAAPCQPRLRPVVHGGCPRVRSLRADPGPLTRYASPAC